MQNIAYYFQILRSCLNIWRWYCATNEKETSGNNDSDWNSDNYYNIGFNNWRTKSYQVSCFHLPTNSQYLYSRNICDNLLVEEMTIKGKTNHYNVKLLKSYGFSTNVNDSKIILKNNMIHSKNLMSKNGMSKICLNE